MINDELHARNLSEEQIKELEFLANMPDEDIDTSDIPEVLDWSGAIRGLFHMAPEAQREAIAEMRARRNTRNREVDLDTKDITNTESLTEIERLGEVIEHPPWDSSSRMWVLDYYDGERIRLIQNPEKDLFLSWWSDRDRQTDRWITLPISHDKFKSMAKGNVSPYDAMTNPEAEALLITDYDVGDWDMPVKVVLVSAEGISEVTFPDTQATFKLEGWLIDLESPDNLLTKINRGT